MNIFNETILDEKNNIVVHCDTRDKAKDLLEWAHSKGKHWGSGDSYLAKNCWSEYEKETCYSLSTGYYGTRGCYDGMVIMPYEDVLVKPVDKKAFTKVTFKYVNRFKGEDQTDMNREGIDRSIDSHMNNFGVNPYIYDYERYLGLTEWDTKESKDVQGLVNRLENCFRDLHPNSYMMQRLGEFSPQRYSIYTVKVDSGKAMYFLNLEDFMNCFDFEFCENDDYGHVHLQVEKALMQNSFDMRNEGYRSGYGGYNGM